MSIKLWFGISSLVLCCCDNNEIDLELNEPPSPRWGIGQSPRFIPDYFNCFDANHCQRRALSDSTACLPDRDYTVSVTPGNSPVVILSFHGGLIEPHTTEVSKEAARRFSWTHYDFSGHGTAACLGTRTDRDQLHITATHFDDPVALNLLSKTGIKSVAIHGNRYLTSPGTMCVGGANPAETAAFKTAIRATNAGFRLYVLQPVDTAQLSTCRAVAGIEPTNLVNRIPGGHGGLQLELSPQLLADLSNPAPSSDPLRIIFYGALSTAMNR